MQWSLILLFLMGQTGFITCRLHQYYYVGERKTWAEAQRYCREKYSDLATVSNMTDMKTIINMSAEAWIGLYNQTGVNRTWYWSLPGVEFNESETNWHSGEPTDRGTGTENCAFIYTDLTWADNSCTQNIPFICYDERNSSHKFHYIEQPKSWLEAQSYCRENHTDLISGPNQIQDGQLKSELGSVGNGSYMFMGLFRDTWRWSDGSSFSFRHWNLQFDNAFNTGRCAATGFNDGGRWKTDSCDTEKPFICYDDKVILIPENKTWEEALSYCRVHHHDLVTITNLDEQRWVQEKVKQASTPFVWTGLRYTCALGFWFWVSDEVVRYKNWVSDGQMDQCDMSGAMETGGQHQWVKRNDAEMFNFICSKD